MSEVIRLKRKPRLRVVTAEPTETVFGSRSFIARDRNPALAPPPRRFVPTIKRPGDVII
jgi:hypothetical protein